MTSHELTNRARLAMLRLRTGQANGRRRSSQRGKPALVVLAAGAIALGGCVSVNAPDKPIVIELNINIKQEVVYRLAADAEKTIDENAGIF
ncbi:MAG: YnbE family lipoprotein [Novosphingobium sp.]